tara:strand:+ start:61 stop:1182 length:1122 start_codon:yes stop_codon:yes gene_type:complete
MLGIVLILFIVLVVLIYLLTNKSNDTPDSPDTPDRVLLNEGTVVDNSDPEQFADSNEVTLNIGDLTVKYTQKPMYTTQEFIEVLENKSDPAVERMISIINNIDDGTDEDIRDLLIPVLRDIIESHENSKEGFNNNENDGTTSQVNTGISGNLEENPTQTYSEASNESNPEVEKFLDAMISKLLTESEKDSWEDNETSFNNLKALITVFIYITDITNNTQVQANNYHNLIANDVKNKKTYLIINFNQKTFDEKLTPQHYIEGKIGQFFIPTEQNTGDNIDSYITCLSKRPSYPDCDGILSKTYSPGEGCILKKALKESSINGELSDYESWHCPNKEKIISPFVLEFETYINSVRKILEEDIAEEEDEEDIVEDV